MYASLTARLLRWLRVPPEPQPPHGDPASLQVFRAGPNFLYLRIAKWAMAQVAAVFGIIFWLGVFSNLEGIVEQKRHRAESTPVATPPPAPTPAEASAARSAEPAPEKKREDRRQRKRWGPVAGFHAWQEGIASFLARLPTFAMGVIWFFEMAGLVIYVLQLPVTFLLARLDYELRWYMVTDRSLRIRHGVWKISESTMSFANIQQVVVSQGPLQRLLGLSDVKVQSAGGGRGEKEHEADQADDMHLGLFHSVTNPTEIRDLVLARLRRFRETGLGDPDEPRSSAPLSVLPLGGSPAVHAAREILAEARALRASLPR